MSGTNFKNGLKVYGAPVLPGAGDQVTTGNVFFVDSGNPNGSDSPSAGTVDKPFLTTDYAVGQCVADNGDIIYVMPGHTEGLTAGTSLVVDVAGVQIIGLGWGHSRPIYDFDNTAATIELDAANTRLSNVILRASVSAVVVGVNVDADDVTVDNCETAFEATGDDFVMMVDVNAFDRATVVNNRFFTEPATAGCAKGVKLIDTHNTVVMNNWFIGDFSDSPIHGLTTLGNGCVISDNLIYNSDTSTNNGIEITAAFTGILANNRVGTLYATSVADLIDPGSMLCLENYTVNAIDESGVLLPATTSA